MTQVERRALYNLLRMNWLNDQNVPAESWQIEDYRQLALSDLFARLKQFDIHLDKTSFIAHAAVCDSPEDLTDHLIGDQFRPADGEDQIYLLVFEIWRRLMNDKPTLSIFCDELDYQIYLYDQGKLERFESLQDALDNLLAILDENVDEGVDPKEAFRTISEHCANDIETFLYDFISEQIDQESESYAQELLDGFSSYLEGNKWFELLRVRVSSLSNAKTASRLFSQLIEDYLEEQDLEFNFELLSFMIEAGNASLFATVLENTVSLLREEQDLHDLLHICIDYYHRRDQENKEKAIQTILDKRSKKHPEETLHPEDPDLNVLMEIVKKQIF
jgi:hypothetical protein